MARALADAGISAVFSYAGRTRQPVGQPLPVRVGGFGGVEGLAALPKGIYPGGQSRATGAGCWNGPTPTA